MARTYKFKTTDATGGRLSPQHPSAPVGMAADGRICTYAVTDVPDIVAMTDVMVLLSHTTLRHGYSVRYDQLGRGAIV